MTPEIQLKSFIDSVNDTVEKLRANRETLNSKKVEMNTQLLSLLESATTDAQQKIDSAYEEGKSHIDDLAPKGQELRAKTLALKDKLQGFVDQYSSVNDAIVLKEEARADIEKMLNKPEEVVGLLEEFRETLGQDCIEFKEKILSKLDDFDQNIDDFVDSSERIQEAISVIEDEVVGHLEQLEESINQANNLYEATVSADHEVLIEKAFERLFDEIEQELKRGMKDVNDAVAKLNESGLDALKDVTAAIGEVNDTLENAIKITEPVKPVLEIASSIA